MSSEHVSCVAVPQNLYNWLRRSRMGRYDKEIKKVYFNYKSITITSFDEFIKYNEIVFSKLLLIIKEYRSRKNIKRKKQFYINNTNIA